MARDPQEAVILLNEENKSLREQLDQARLATSAQTSIGVKLPAPDASSPQPPYYSRKVQRHESIYFKRNKVTYIGPTNWRALLDYGHEYTEIVEAAKTFVANGKREWKDEKNMKESGTEGYRDMGTSTPDSLLKSLSDYLPDYYTVKEYLNIYLRSYWHHSTPVTDDVLLMNDFDQIFEKEFGPSDKIKFNIKNKTVDYAKVALVLVCIKLSITTKNMLATTEAQLYDQNDDLLHYVERLLDFSNYLVEANIPLLQTLFLLFQIKRTSRVENDGAGDGRNGILIFKTALNMAIMLGLNRDIKLLHNKESPQVIKVLKNIWKALLVSDACMAFSQGLPLGIDSDFLDFHSLEGEDPWIRFTMILRNASRLLNRTKDCTVGEVMNIIEKFETFDQNIGLSSLVSSFKTPDDFSTNLENVDYLELRLLATYALHILYEIVYLSLEPTDTIREEFYNGIMKYGSLVVQHLIQLQSRLNVKYLDPTSSLTPEQYNNKLHHMVEISMSLNSISNVMFLKTFNTLCLNVLERLKENPSMTNLESISVGKLKQANFESFDIRDHNSLLARSFRSPTLLHGLLGLICKHLLYLHNESFGKVYGFSFCLYAMISLFKYFNNLLTKKLSKDQLSTVLYDAQNKQEAESILGVNHLNTENINDIAENWKNVSSTDTRPIIFPNPNYNNGRLSLSDHSISDNSLSDNIAAPSSATGSVNGFDFFDWKNKPVDELFQNILMNDKIFTLDISDESLSWLNAPDTDINYPKYSYEGQ